MLRVFFFTMIGLFSVPGLSQTINQNKEAEKTHRELSTKAMKQLEEIALEAASLKLPENRMRVQVIVADLLWAKDEPRARALIADIKEYLISQQSLSNEDDDQPGNSVWLLQQLRQEMIQKLVQRDPLLALEFLRATRHPHPDETMRDNEIQYELSLASQIANQAGQQSIQIAEELLAKGKLQSGLIEIALAAAKNDRASATRLISKILSHLRATDLLTRHENYQTAMELIRNSAVSLPDGSNDASASSPSDNQPLITEAMAREVIQMMVNSLSGFFAASPTINAERLNTAQNLLNEMNSIWPLVEKYTPSQSPALKLRLEQLQQSENPTSKAWNEMNRMYETGTMETLLETAAKVPPEMRDHYYQRAAWKARETGNITAARNILSEHLHDPHQRQQALAEIDQQLISKATQENRITEARQLIDRVTKKERRAAYLTQVAIQLLFKEDQKTAQQLLDEACAMICGMPETQQQFTDQLLLAKTFQTISPSRSLEIMEAAAHKLNELFEAEFALDKFRQGDTFRKQEWRMQSGTTATYLLQMWASTLAAIAITDFDHAQELANTLSRLETRLFARLLITQSVIQSQTPLNQRNAITVSKTLSIQ